MAINASQAAAPRQTVDAKIRQAEALKLRIRGYHYRRIAEELGVSVSTAYHYVIDGLNETKALVEERAEEARTLECARLDDWQQRLESKGERLSAREIDTLIRISERRAKLLGIDAPSRSEWSGIGGKPIEIGGAIDLNLVPLPLLRKMEAIQAELEALKLAAPLKALPQPEEPEP